MNEALPELSRVVTSCACCGSESLVDVCAAGSSHSAIKSCSQCGLFLSTPTLPFERLQIFYCEDFEGDAGSAAARLAGKAAPIFQRSREKARSRDLPIVKRYMDGLRGKSILDLRSRDGALALEMREEGALVCASDPMLPNVEKCLRSGLRAYQIGVFEHSDLGEFETGSFDAVVGLTIHVLAHLPQPDLFLKRVLALLKPGGILLLDEKDVFQPARLTSGNIFDSGVGHFYHFTKATLDRMVSRAGFEILTVEQHPHRRSAFRHILLCARRPRNEQPAVQRPGNPFQPEAHRSELNRVQRKAALLAPVNKAKLRLKKLRRWVGRDAPPDAS